MMYNNSGNICRIGCWGFAAGIGVTIAIWLQGSGGWGLFSAFLVGTVIGIILALVFPRIFCKRADASQAAAEAAASATSRAAGSTVTATTATRARAMTDDDVGSIEPAAPVAHPAEPMKATATNRPAKAATKPVAKPTAKAAAKPAAKPAAKTAPAKPASKPAASKAANAKPAPKQAASGNTGTPKKPRALKEPRKAGADNLKEIKGIGPALEKMLNGMGFYHFDQVAKWTADEVAWVDDNLEGFKGRVSRDEWVKQARTLAAGGETAFSKRVNKGQVY